MAPRFLADISGESISVIGTMVVGVLTLLINNWFTEKRRQNDRTQDRLDKTAAHEQDRLDRQELARLTERKADEVAALTVATANSIKDAADKRESRLVASIAVVGDKADAAYVAGNGNQEKFAAVQTVLAVHAKALESPTKVEIANDADHPVPTKVV